MPASLLISTKGGGCLFRDNVSSAHPLVEDLIGIDISALAKLAPGDHVVAPTGSRFEIVRVAMPPTRDEIALSVVDGEAERVVLEQTPCNFGGTRSWFICPNSECGRRCGKLYLQVGDRWACRTCADARYRSQRQRAQERCLARARKLRERLGGPLAHIEPLPVKPPNMHWDTYDRRLREIRARESVGIMMLVGAADRDLDRLEKRFSARSTP
jgi:hypothetical protein